MRGETDGFIEALRNADAILARTADATDTTDASDAADARLFLTRELVDGLSRNDRHHDVMEVYDRLPPSFQDEERIAVTAAISALRCGRDHLLRRVIERRLAYIKEGETRLVDAWYLWQAELRAAERGTAATEEDLKEARRTLTPPENIDFSMA